MDLVRFKKKEWRLQRDGVFESVKQVDRLRANADLQRVNLGLVYLNKKGKSAYVKFIKLIYTFI